MSSTKRFNSFHDGVWIDLFITDCATCGVIFGIPRSLEARLRENHKSFYCPGGHSMVFRDREQSERERLQQSLDREKRLHGYTRESLEASRAVAQREKRRAAAAKGQLTKMRKRVAAGFCPDGSCHVEFVDIRDHIHAAHPELVDQMVEYV